MIKSYEHEKRDTAAIIMAMTKEIDCTDSKAYSMLNKAWQNIYVWNISKLNRWIGYAQCLMVAEGTLTLEEIMSITREIVND